MYRNIKDLTGHRFGRLIVLGFSHRDKHRSNCWRCQCDCGKEYITRGSRLINGNTKSCGCLLKEHAKLTAVKNTIHGNTRKDMQGKHYTPTYKSWESMRLRCNNPNATGYDYYGGRGIKVCPEWDDFRNFLRDMGERPQGTSIDRIDPNGNYCKENCRWATGKEQLYNRKNTLNVFYNGMNMTIKEWAKKINIRYPILRYRIVIAKWPIEKAFTTPVGGQVCQH